MTSAGFAAAATAPQPVAVEMATWGRRVGALLVDVLVNAALLAPAWVAVWAVAANVGDDGDLAPIIATVAVTVVHVVLTVVYRVVGDSAGRQTWGRQVAGIRVVRGDGVDVGRWHVVGREMAKSLSSLALLVGWLMPLWDPQRRALHDRVAGTYVIRAEQPVGGAGLLRAVALSWVLVVGGAMAGGAAIASSQRDIEVPLADDEWYDGVDVGGSGVGSDATGADGLSGGSVSTGGSGSTGGGALSSLPPSTSASSRAGADDVPDADEAVDVADAYLAVGSGNDVDAFVERWVFPASHYETLRDEASLRAEAGKYFAAYPSRDFTRTTPVTVTSLEVGGRLAFSFRFRRISTDGTLKCGVRNLFLDVELVGGAWKVRGAREPDGVVEAC